ncbi:hypothetical protein [Mycobacterium persicum]|uniref:hypothetical protein n=1 Tax=Mycobacterium persicum TaxID=1487726 RepID=UPI000B5AEA41|nr:hypothetical protein [Mycobacterium persicum]
MTMKLRIKMSHKEDQLAAKVADHGLSVDDAERIHERVAEALGDEASYFGNMKKLLGIADQDATSVEYSSILWPGFDFTAIASEDGFLESARYRHKKRNSPTAGSPIGLPIWSMDVAEFTERFGPMNGGRQWPLFDKLLPAYEEYEFSWEGASYGAGFSWGLFMFSAKSWD